MTSKKMIKSALESMLFVWGELLPAKDAAAVFDITTEEAVELLEELAEEYKKEERGIEIRRVGNAFQFVTKSENEEFVKRLCTPVKVRRLSQAALEVLAIIAYRQPVTKGEIDAIRGIKSDRVIEGLMRRELVRDAGRSDAVGRPVLYRTTDEFLKQFGFTSLKELPKIDDIEGVLGIDPDAEEEESRQLEIEMETEHGDGNL